MSDVATSSYLLMLPLQLYVSTSVLFTASASFTLSSRRSVRCRDAPLDALNVELQVTKYEPELSGLSMRGMASGGVKG